MFTPTLQVGYIISQKSILFYFGEFLLLAMAASYIRVRILYVYFPSESLLFFLFLGAWIVGGPLARCYLARRPLTKSHDEITLAWSRHPRDPICPCRRHHLLASSLFCCLYRGRSSQSLLFLSTATKFQVKTYLVGSWSCFRTIFRLADPSSVRVSGISFRPLWCSSLWEMETGHVRDQVQVRHNGYHQSTSSC